MGQNQSRLDASESIFFSRQLETIDPRIYDIKFELLRGRFYLPKIAGVGEYDNEYTYRIFETKGRAKIIAPNADDVPMVNVTGTEHTTRIKLLSAGYKFSVEEVKAAAAKGKPLDDFGARGVARAIAEEIDDLLATGSTSHGMTGFINHALVDDSFTLVTKSAGGTTWGTLSAPNANAHEMVADVSGFAASHWAALKDAEGLGGKLTIVLPATAYALLATTPMGDNADKTALSYLASNNPFIESIDYWHKLDGAGAGTSGRMISYRKDPMVLGALIPREMTPEPWEQRGLNLLRLHTAKCGGAVIRYPVAVKYADGL